MRIVTPSMVFGAALIFALSGGASLAQDQPAAGAPPSAAESQPAAGSPTSDAQPSNAPTNDAQPAGEADGAAPPMHAPNPAREAKSLARRLDLTPQQESAIEPVLAERQQKVEEARSNASLPPRAKRARVQEIESASDGKIEAILTDGQKQQYEQLKQERRANRQMRRQQPAGAPPAASNQ